jgi:hypothetical protein
MMAFKVCSNRTNRTRMLFSLLVCDMPANPGDDKEAVHLW